MIFSDLLGDSEPILQGLAPAPVRRPRRDHLSHPRRGRGVVSRSRGCSSWKTTRPTRARWSTPRRSRPTTWRRSPRFGSVIARNASSARIDYVPLHTGMPFDKALMSYLLSRQARGWVDVARLDGPEDHGHLADPCRTGGGGGAGGPAGDPAPVHAADAQARHLPRPAVDARTAEAVEEAARVKNWLLLLARMACWP